MNRKRLADLADIIENDRLPNVTFNFMSWAKQNENSKHWCATNACIAGYAVCAAFGNARAKELNNRACGVMRAATRILDLTDKEAMHLFTLVKLRNVPTKEQAVRVLRHAAKTGKIDWNMA